MPKIECNEENVNLSVKKARIVFDDESMDKWANNEGWLASNLKIFDTFVLFTLKETEKHLVKPLNKIKQIEIK